jgi:hypothetical protein
MDVFGRASRSSLDMAQEQSDQDPVDQERAGNEEGNRDSRTEKTEVVAVKAVPADYDTALSQLNSLDAPNGAGKPKVDGASEPAPKKRVHFQSGSEPRQGIAVDAAPATDTDAALALLSELCALGEKRQAAAGTSKPPPAESANRDASERTSEILPAHGGSAPSSLSDELTVERTSEHLRRNRPNFDFRTDQADIVAVNRATTEYQAALLQIIESAANDPRELRRLVYELARASAQKEPGHGSSPSPGDMRDLEAAIARIEVDLSRVENSNVRLSGFDAGPDVNDGLAPAQLPTAMSWLVARNRANDIRAAALVPLRPDGSQGSDLVRGWTWPPKREARRPETAGSRLGGLSASSGAPAAVEIVYPEREAADAVRVRRRVWLWFVVWPLVQLIGVAGFCFALYVAVSGRLDVQEARTREAAAVTEPQQSPPAESARPSGLPLPSTYGVYAVSGGSLNELQSLPIRAPDPRVQLSAEINKPSSSILPDGKIAFILFRRELVNSAPQKISIRVVARVASALTFSSGKAATLTPEASWHIRANSYDFPVSPLNENREMVAARPEDPDFSFPSGRYVLVFEGLAYDFTVDGPITDPAQCLESFEAVNGPVFGQCAPK